MPNVTTINRAYKPVLFLLFLSPAAGLLWAAFYNPAALGANPIETILHSLGLWGLRFLLLTLAMTPLKDILGNPWPIAFRRMLGLYAFFYVLLHFLTWLILDQELLWANVIKDIIKRPFITIGFIALLLLVPLAITSTNGMIRRLGSARWRKLHRLIYVIVLLGVWHFYWQVKSDIREPLVYFAIACALLGWRVWQARRRRIAATARESNR